MNFQTSYITFFVVFWVKDIFYLLLTALLTSLKSRYELIMSCLSIYKYNRLNFTMSFNLGMVVHLMWRSTTKRNGSILTYKTMII
jgi:hypothetical protein